MSYNNDPQYAGNMANPAYPNPTGANPSAPPTDYQPPSYPNQGQFPNQFQNPNPNQGQFPNQFQNPDPNQGQFQNQGQFNQFQNPNQNQGQFNQFQNPNQYPQGQQQIIIIQAPANNNQPESAAPKFGPDWEEALLGCCSDPCCCLIMMMLPPLSLWCTQIQAVTTATKSTCWTPWCLIKRCGCFGFALNRGSIRRAYGIQGSFCGDCCTHLFCHICAINQEYREARKRG